MSSAEPLKVIADPPRDATQRMKRVALYKENGDPFLPADLGVETPEAWHAVATAGMSNGWSTTAPGTPPQYRKRLDGVVELQGNVSPGTTGQTIFTLPAGYRPNKNEQLLFPSAGQGGACVGVEVYPDGTIKALGTVNTLSWISLSAIRFSVD